MIGQNLVGQPTMSEGLENPLQGMTSSLPQTPQEVQQKKGAWSMVLDDPNMKSALFRMGLQLMRGKQDGEGTVQGVARAGMDAMDYYSFKNEMDRKRALEDQRLGLETKKTDADIAESQASTASKVQNTGQEAQKFKEWEMGAENRKKQVAQELRNAELTGDVKKAELIRNNYEAESAQKLADFKAAHPDLDEASMIATMQLPSAQLSTEKARAQQASSSATASSAQADKTRFETDSLRDLQGTVPPWLRALEQSSDTDAYLYALANKDSKSQSEIMQGIRNKEHHGYSRKEDKTITDASGYAALDADWKAEYARLPEAEKKEKGTYLNWIQLEKTPTLAQAVVKHLGGKGTAIPKEPKVTTMSEINSLAKRLKLPVEKVKQDSIANGYTIQGN
jgi:hypothetical protein